VLVLVLVLVLVRRCWCAGETLPLFLDGAFTFWLLTTFHEQGGRRRIDQERERERDRETQATILSSSPFSSSGTKNKKKKNKKCMQHAHDQEGGRLLVVCWCDAV
jgi:hypothetical protein